ncbi:MAG: peptidylprolyl isomerase [Sneathiella sp.]|nr:MAG: peptidylprolyl isomerase [Sneathiella sp.]
MTLLLAMVSLLALPLKAIEAADLENTLYLDLENGRVVIELLPDLAPNHVARIKELTREKFYDGLKFHRVIEDFMVQTGDPKGNGTGGSGRKIRSEFSSTPHVRGIVSMARSSSPHSADSQFYIVTADSPWLDNKYTVWGRVVEGMEFVDMIKKGMGSSGIVRGEADIIVQMQVAADAQ